MVPLMIETAHLREHFSVSRGVRRVYGYKPEGMEEYEHGAIVPLGDWTSPPSVFAEKFVCNSVAEHKPFFSLVNVSALVRPLWDLNLLRPGGLESKQAEAATHIWYSDFFRDTIRDIWPNCDEPKINGYKTDRANQETVTINYRTNKTLGLHIDTWENVPMASRRSALLRFSINVGFSDRFFIFSTTPVDSFMDDSSEEYVYSGKKRYSYTEQLRDKAPDANLDLVRVRIPPGFGYIAATDLVVHDGSSMGIIEPSAHFTVRGAFHVGAENNVSRISELLRS